MANTLGGFYYEVGVKRGKDDEFDKLKKELESLNSSVDINVRFEKLKEAADAMASVGRSLEDLGYKAKDVQKDIANAMDFKNVKMNPDSLKLFNNIEKEFENFVNSGKKTFGKDWSDIISNIINESNRLKTDIKGLTSIELKGANFNVLNAFVTELEGNIRRVQNSMSALSSGGYANITPGDRNSVQQQISALMQMNEAAQSLLKYKSLIGQNETPILLAPKFDLSKINTEDLKTEISTIASKIAIEIGSVSLGQTAISNIQQQLAETPIKLENLNVGSILNVQQLENVVKDLQNIKEQLGVSLNQLMAEAGKSFSKSTEGILPKGSGSDQIEIDNLIKNIKEGLSKIELEIKSGHISQEAIQMIENDLKKARLVLENVEVKNVQMQQANASSASSAEQEKKTINDVVMSIEKLGASMKELNPSVAFNPEQLEKFSQALMVIIEKLGQVRDAMTNIKMPEITMPTGTAFSQEQIQSIVSGFTKVEEKLVVISDTLGTFAKLSDWEKALSSIAGVIQEMGKASNDAQKTAESEQAQVSATEQLLQMWQQMRAIIADIERIVERISQVDIAKGGGFSGLSRSFEQMLEMMQRMETSLAHLDAVKTHGGGVAGFFRALFSTQESIFENTGLEQRAKQIAQTTEKTAGKAAESTKKVKTEVSSLSTALEDIEARFKHAYNNAARELGRVVVKNPEADQAIKTYKELLGVMEQIQSIKGSRRYEMMNEFLRLPLAVDSNGNVDPYLREYLAKARNEKALSIAQNKSGVIGQSSGGRDYLQTLETDLMKLQQLQTEIAHKQAGGNLMGDAAKNAVADLEALIKTMTEIKNKGSVDLAKELYSSDSYRRIMNSINSNLRVDTIDAANERRSQSIADAEERKNKQREESAKKEKEHNENVEASINKQLAAIAEIRRHREEITALRGFRMDWSATDSERELQRIEAFLNNILALTGEARARTLDLATKEGLLSTTKATHMQGEEIGRVVAQMREQNKTEKTNEQIQLENAKASARAAQEELNRQKALERLKTTIIEVTNAIKRMENSNADGKNNSAIQRLQTMLYELQSMSGLSSKAANSYSKLIKDITGESAEKAGKTWTNATNAQKQFESQTLQTLKSITSLDQQFSMLAMNIQNAFSIIGLQQFAKEIIHIGGELERQKLAMGSIFGDDRLAESMYNQVAELSMKSPFTVQDLVKNTKQLSAFGVEYDKLFDTTKRLSDIAAAVGVDFGRIAYEYGQMESMGYLDARHLRMFSMSGIPLAQELAKYYTNERGVDVGVEEVRKMMMKRQVSADVVKSILQDMTNEGGKFFNMQEVMAESLASKYANLENAMNLMYGRMAEGPAGDWLKSLAETLTGLAESYESVGTYAIWLTGAFVAQKAVAGLVAAAHQTAAMAILEESLSQKKLNAEQIKAVAANGAIIIGKEAVIKESYKEIAANSALSMSQKATMIAMSGLDKVEKINLLTKVGLSEASAAYVATTNFASAATLRLKLAVISLNDAIEKNAFLIAAVAIGALVAHYINVRREANALKNELSDLENKTSNTYASMSSELDRLIKRLHDEMITQKEREQVIKTIQSQYGEYLGKLDLESASYDEVAAAATRAKDAIRAKLKAQLVDDKINAVNSNTEDQLNRGRERTRELLTEELQRIGSNANVGNILQQIEEGLIDGYSIGQIGDALKRELGDAFDINNLQKIEKWSLSSNPIGGLFDLSSVYFTRRKLLNEIEKGSGITPYDSIKRQISDFYKEMFALEKDEIKVKELKSNMAADIADAMRITGKIILRNPYTGAEIEIQGAGRGYQTTAEDIKKFEDEAGDLYDAINTDWYSTATRVAQKYAQNVKSNVMPSSINFKDMDAFYKHLKDTRDKSKEQVDFFEKRKNELKKVNKSLSKEDLAEYTLAKDSYDAIEAISKALGGIDWDSLGKSKKGSTKKDKTEKERLSRQIDLIREAYQEYTKWYGQLKDAKAAAAKVSGGTILQELFNEEQFPDNEFSVGKLMENIDKVWEKVKNNPKLTGDEKIELELKIGRLRDTEGYDEAVRNFEKDSNEIKARLEREFANYNLFEKMLEATGNGVIDIKGKAVKAWDNISRQLASELETGMKSRGISGLIDWDMTEDQAMVFFGHDGKLVSMYLEIKKRIEQNGVKMFEDIASQYKDALSETEKYLIERNNLTRKYNEDMANNAGNPAAQRMLTAVYNSKMFAADVAHWKANPMNEYVLNNLSTSSKASIKAVSDSIDELIKKGEGIVPREQMKELFDAQGKLFADTSGKSLFGNVGEAAKAAKDAIDAVATAKKKDEQAKANLVEQENSLWSMVASGATADTIARQEEVVAAAEKSATEAADELSDAEREQARTAEKLKKAFEDLGDKFSQFGSIFSKVGGSIGGDLGNVISSLGSGISSIGDVMKSWESGGALGKTNAILGGVVAIYDISRKLDEAVSNMNFEKYERAAAKQAEINNMKDAVYEYARAVEEANAKERDWFSKTSLSGIGDIVKRQAAAREALEAEKNERQVAYRNQTHGGWGNYFVAGLSAAAGTAAALWTGGASAAIGWGTAAGLAGASMVAGAEAIVNAVRYADGRVNAIDNLVIETRKKSNGWADLGWFGAHDQETQSLQSWLDDSKKIFDAYQQKRNGVLSEDAFDNVVDSVGRASKEKAAFAKAMLAENLADFKLFDDNNRFNVELAESILANETMADDLMGETKETLQGLIKYQKEIDEATEQLRDAVSSMASPIVDNMVDAVWDWFDNGIDALDAFHEKASDTFRNIASEMIKQMMLDDIFGEYSKQLETVIKRYGDVYDTDAFENETWLARELASISGNMVKGYEGALPVVQRLLEQFDQDLKEVGNPNGLSGSGSSGSSLKSSIQGMQEETADLLAAYLNAIRQDVSVDRSFMEEIVNYHLPAIESLLDNSIIEDVPFEEIIPGSSAKSNPYYDPMALAEVSSELTTDTNLMMQQLVYMQVPMLNATASAQLAQLNMQTEYLRVIQENTSINIEAVTQMRDELHSVIYGSNRINV